MLTYKMLKNLIEDINNVIGPRLYILPTEESKSSNLNDLNNIVFMESILLDGGIYDIYINDAISLSEREIGIVKLLLEDRLNSDSIRQQETKERDILRLLHENMKELEIENTLVRLGISTNEEVLTFVIKLYESDDYLEVISIVENIISDSLVICTRVQDDMIAICSSNKGDLNVAEMIAGTIETELYKRIKIGVGAARKAIEIKKTYEEALDALKIGEKYELPGNVFIFSSLLIYRIIDQISKSKLVEEYSEIIDEYMSKLTKDDIKTANVFLDSNLNISEASRQLYIHRNTLIYRLDKIQKDTGFDLRLFSDSLKFKLLLVIYQYLNH